MFYVFNHRYQLALSMLTPPRWRAQFKRSMLFKRSYKLYQIAMNV
jgi:hypothetical protein